MFSCFVGLTVSGSDLANDIQINIPKGYAIETLGEAARQSGVELFFSVKVVKGVQTNPVSGFYEPIEAFGLMLEGTGLSILQQGRSGVFSVRKDKPKTEKPRNIDKMKLPKDTPKGFMKKLLGIVVATGAAASSPAQEGLEDDPEVFTLSPFEVTAEENVGYTAASTLAGNRLSTDLKDVGSAISVVTKEFLEDVGATDNTSLLQYTVGTEVGGERGSFAGTGNSAQLNEDTITPSQNTRVRGLSAADNTRDFFRTAIPWDGYNIQRVDLQRGPNSILFGQGSPSGIINAGLAGADFGGDSNAIEVRFGSHGTLRGALDLNREILEDELSIRVDALYQDKKYQQDPAFSKDSRVYTAIRYEPKFLQGNGGRMTIKANYEKGSIDSNNPRYLPPVDTITPWFGDLNQATYNQYQAWDHISGRPNHGQMRVNLAIGQPNSYYKPSLGVFGYPGNPDAPHFITVGGNQEIWALNPTGPYQTGGLAADGSVDGSIEGLLDNKWVSLVGTAQMAINGGLDYAAAGLWKNDLITDPSVFDFYNTLIDGDTKREWQDFDVFNASFSQTFLEDKVGIMLDFNSEHYENGQKAILPGEVRLQVDAMTVFGDGTSEAGYNGGVPFSDGTPNPNVGRAFVSSNNGWSNRSSDNDRKTVRATGFATHDFDKGSDNWFRQFLGTHTLTGMLSEETFESDARAWQRFGVFDDAIYGLPGFEAARFNGVATPAQIIYLGDSLLGGTASGANIPGIIGQPTLTSGSINYFDSTWTGAVNADPAAPWEFGVYTEGSEFRTKTQSENPANYAGWTSRSFNIVDAESSPAMRDRLTTAADLRKSTTESEVIAWQGKWLQDSIATTFGWRKDTAKSWALSSNPNMFPYTEDRGSMGSYLNSNDYRLPNSHNEIEVQSRSYSGAIHLMDLPFIDDLTENLPFEVSLLYNRATNFKPDASRVDILGLAHPAPSGKTIDKGIRIATRDGRYSLKLNKYETLSNAATSTQINASAIGHWMQMTQLYANVFEYNILPWGQDASSPELVGNATDIEGDDGIWRMRYNHHYFNTEGRTWSDQAVFSSDGNWVVDPVLEQSIMDSVRAMQREVDPRFWEAWGIKTFGDFGRPDSGAESYTVPAGFTIVEDNVSEGYEIEIGAEPMDGWRLTANASKTDARRTNVGNENIRALLGTIESALRIGEPDGVGALHHYWGSEDVVTAGKNWYDGEGLAGAPGSEWRLAQLIEDTTVPELREWRFNLITNYDFQEGRLAGLNLGGAMRYQSSMIVAYPPSGDPQNPATVEYDFSNPVKSPSSTSYDFWVGYGKQLNDRIHWQMQLNVYDAFEGGDSLIPITAQPNGEFAAFRIGPKRTWSVSNTFTF